MNTSRNTDEFKSDGYTELTALPVLTEAQKNLLAEKNVLVLGLGGLGGYLCEYLCRANVGHLTIVDGDRFEKTNLDRQLNAVISSLGKSKAEETKKRIRSVNPECHVTAVDAFFDAKTAPRLIKDQDLILDGLDSPAARLLAADTASAYGIPFIHGAIDGWTLQAGTVLPGNQMLHQLYPAWKSFPLPGKTLSFIPAVCAGIQVSEAVKLLCGQKARLENRLFLMDLSGMETQIIDFS